MTTIDEAWTWYRNTRQQVRLMQRLAESYWDNLPWDEVLARDRYFRSASQARVAAETAFSLLHLDDLAVVVLFSVFEAIVRSRVLDEVDAEAGSIYHRVLRLAVQEARQRVEEGSFFRVLEPFKDAHPDLVEEVNQVRRYRNWVAHGRRGKPPEAVVPRTAYDRLQRFLSVVMPAPPPAPPSPEGPPP
jgi:hypothetical protein